MNIIEQDTKIIESRFFYYTPGDNFGILHVDVRVRMWGFGSRQIYPLCFHQVLVHGSEAVSAAARTMNREPVGPTAEVLNLRRGYQALLTRTHDLGRSATQRLDELSRAYINLHGGGGTGTRRTCPSARR